MPDNTPDVTLRRGEALLHEDLITPLHDHEESRNRLLATIDGRTRVVTPEQANSLVAVKRPNKRIDEVEHTPTGPRFARRGLFRGSLIGLGGLLAAPPRPGTPLQRTADATCWSACFCGAASTGSPPSARSVTPPTTRRAATCASTPG
ncbi:MAG TPA: hypothetical protein VGK53_08805 [Propionicimonas sp.]|jgi:hypothetical protein